MARKQGLQVGVLSDTHGRFDAALPLLFARCDLIVHAGDIMGREILFQLSSLAPVEAVRGNNDTGTYGEGLEDVRVVKFGDLDALLIHILGKPEKPAPEARKAIERSAPRIVIYGHSHKPAVTLHDGVLYLNPGSAGPRRFSLPRTAGVLTVTGRRVHFELNDLEDPRLPRFGPAYEFEL